MPPVPRIWGPGKPRTPCAKRARLDGQSLADYFFTSSHNDSQKSFFKSSTRYILFARSFSRKLPVEAETSPNSLSRRILQGTSLLSGFYSATLSVTSRKQGICIQNTGGVPLRDTRIEARVGDREPYAGCPRSLAFGDQGIHDPHARNAPVAWTASPRTQCLTP